MSDASVFSGGPMNHPVNRLTDHLAECRRILIWGGMGTGKSTLALTLSRRLSGPAGCCQILELDPGRPPFGMDLIGIPASPQAARPSSRERAEQRTALWDAYLAKAISSTSAIRRG